MNKKIIFPIVAAVPLLVGGCATQVTYQQPNQQFITTGINIQDYTTAANDAVNDLLASGALDKVSNPPAVLFVSHIINDTGQQVDTDLLTQKITRALNQSGKAVTTSTDPAAKGYSEENQFMNDQQNQRLPDFTLSGKIIETIDRAGSSSLTTYTFQLSLNDTKNAYQVWEGEKQIGKVSSQAPVGF
jgi:penicillin-binding protein activator